MCLCLCVCAMENYFDKSNFSELCVCLCGLFYHLDFIIEEFMQTSKHIIFSSNVIHSIRVLHSTRFYSRFCLPRYKVTTSPSIRFIVFARENLTRNIITHLNSIQNEFMICCVNEPCHFHRAKRQRE